MSWERRAWDSVDAAHRTLADRIAMSLPIGKEDSLPHPPVLQRPNAPLAREKAHHD